MQDDVALIGIVIADRHALFRHGLIGLLRTARPDWRLFEAGSVEDLEDQLLVQKTALVLVDPELPQLCGTDGLRRLRTLFPDRIFAVLSDCDERSTILDWLSAGAQGYLLKSASLTQFVRAIDTILAGGVFAPASLIGGAVSQQVHIQTDPSTLLAQLTGRQRDVFDLLAEGCATKTIARRLNLAVGTVKVHLAGIYRVLGASSRLEALAKVHRQQMEMAPSYG
ncbi:MAG: response regulator transcription factor [Acetobacteraceae bacterium]|nr:response regulator transcription factor [Acetobacteraceae bacterium]